MRRIIAAVVALAGVIAWPAAANAYITYGGQVLHHKYHVVYVESHAPSFPVQSRVNYLRLMQPGVDVRYGACRSGAGCVKVYQMHRGRHTSPGMTYFGIYPDLSLVEPVVTRYDLDYPWTDHDRKQAACHEVLRGLGIGYVTSSYSTCMHASLNGGASSEPAWEDIYNLRGVY